MPLANTRISHPQPSDTLLHWSFQDQWGDASAVVTFASVAVSFAATCRLADVAVAIAGAVVAA